MTSLENSRKASGLVLTILGIFGLVNVMHKGNIEYGAVFQENMRRQIHLDEQAALERTERYFKERDNRIEQNRSIYAASRSIYDALLPFAFIGLGSYWLTKKPKGETVSDSRK